MTNQWLRVWASPRTAALTAQDGTVDLHVYHAHTNDEQSAPGQAGLPTHHIQCLTNLLQRDGDLLLRRVAL